MIQIHLFLAVAIVVGSGALQMSHSHRGKSMLHMSSVSAISARPIMKTLLSSRSTVEAKQAAFKPFENLRKERNEEYEQVLDDMFGILDSNKNNKFSKRRMPVALPSFRVKLGSLQRLLDDTVANKEDAAQQRRGLLIILGQLQNMQKGFGPFGKGGGIRALEKEALSSQKELTMQDMLLRTPDLETPLYSVVEQRTKSVACPAWEIRAYEDFSVCSFDVPSTNSADSSTSGSAVGAPKGGPQGFNSLAGYIFGRNQEAIKMSMTTPVMTYESDDDGKDSGKMKMSFIMPSNYWGEDKLGTAPTPVEGSGVTVEMSPVLQKGVKTFAVLWFGGYSTNGVSEKKKTQLQTALKEDAEYEVVPGAKPFLSQFNDPFQPPWKRRNEVSISIRKRGTESESE